MENGRFSIEDIARIADIAPSTAEEWIKRGYAIINSASACTVHGALCLTAVSSLVRHGLTPRRAAEVLKEFESCDIGPHEHLYVFVLTFGSQVSRTYFYAGDAAAAERYIQELFSVTPVPNSEGEYEAPMPLEAPKFRIVRYDIGPDLQRALREIGKCSAP